MLLPDGYKYLWYKFKVGSLSAGRCFAKLINKHYKIKRIMIKTKNSLELSRSKTLNKMLEPKTGKNIQLITNVKQSLEPELNSLSLVSLVKETESLYNSELD
jgi:hypothetical protein